MDTVRITRDVYQQICNTIGQTEPECGGILGAQTRGLISEYYFDVTGQSFQNGYVPDVEKINNILENDWMPQGIIMVGIVHSHSNGNGVLSCGDISYGIRILQALDTVDRFYLPIVTVKEENIQMNGYIIQHDEAQGFTCRKIECEIV